MQVEGAVADDGRKPSIWDTYTHSGKMQDRSTEDVSADQYHHYKEDVRLMFKMGLDAYRFSISWSRLIPDGKGAINPKGSEYYNNLINEFILHSQAKGFYEQCNSNDVVNAIDKLIKGHRCNSKDF